MYMYILLRNKSQIYESRKFLLYAKRLKVIGYLIIEMEKYILKYNRFETNEFVLPSFTIEMKLIASIYNMFLYL